MRTCCILCKSLISLFPANVFFVCVFLIWRTETDAVGLLPTITVSCCVTKTTINVWLTCRNWLDWKKKCYGKQFCDFDFSSRYKKKIISSALKYILTHMGFHEKNRKLVRFFEHFFNTGILWVFFIVPITIQ